MAKKKTTRAALEKELSAMLTEDLAHLTRAERIAWLASTNEQLLKQRPRIFPKSPDSAGTSRSRPVSHAYAEA
jgi:hypothetical protein